MPNGIVSTPILLRKMERVILAIARVPLRHCATLRLERVIGIEPTLSAWKAGVLPLNYTRER